MITKLIMRITNLNQEELANYLGVSRASVNSWLKSKNMSAYQKRIIGKKFNIPIEYLNVDLNDNLDIYEKVYSIVKNNWSDYKSESEDELEDNINLIEYNVEFKNSIKLSDEQIIDSLCNAYNPYTGHFFEKKHILNDEQIKAFLVNIKDNFFVDQNK